MPEPPEMLQGRRRHNCPPEVVAELRGGWLRVLGPSFYYICLHKPSGGKPVLCLAADYYAAEHEGLRLFDKAVFYRGCLHAEARLPPEALEAAGGGVLLTIWGFDESVAGYCGLEKGGGAVCDVEEVPLYCRYADPLADAMVCRSRGWPLKLRRRLARLLAGDAIDAAWKLLSWLEENTAYEIGDGESVMSPMEFLSARRGECGDYAAFTAAALASAGYKPYILLLRGHGRQGHAVAALNIAGTLFILDQRRPPIEAGAYMAEVFSPRGEVASYLVAVNWREREPILVARRETRLTHQPPRVTPRDYERLAASTREALRRREGWQPVRQLATVIRELGMALVFRGAAGSAETGSGKTVPVVKFYHPLMHWQWASFLADKLSTGVRINERWRGIRYFWATIDPGQGVLLYGTEHPPPRVSVGEKSLSIACRAGCSVEDIDLILYRRRGGHVEPIAGIAPRDMVYSELETLEARWLLEEQGETLLIRVELGELLEVLRERFRDTVLAVEHLGEPVYARRVEAFTAD